MASAPNPDFINNAVGKIWPLVSERNCVVWIGSGLSLVAGYPTWLETVNELCRECGVSPLSKAEADSNETLLLVKADECKAKDLRAYCGVLQRLFGHQVVQSRHAYYLAAELGFKGYVTTNYDPLLQVAAELKGYEIHHYPDLFVARLGGQATPVYYIHGLISAGTPVTGQELILSGTDFEDAYGGMLKGFLYQLLAEYPVVFIGCRLRESQMFSHFVKVEEILNLLAGTHPRKPRPKRFALLSATVNDATGESDDRSRKAIVEQEDERFREMGIEVLRYDPANDSHPEIEQVLEILLKRKRGQPSIARDQSSAHEVLR